MKFLSLFWDRNTATCYAFSSLVYQTKKQIPPTKRGPSSLTWMLIPKHLLHIQQQIMWKSWEEAILLIWKALG